jgi:hypothetical protein
MSKNDLDHQMSLIAKAISEKTPKDAQFIAIIIAPEVEPKYVSSFGYEAVEDSLAALKAVCDCLEKRKCQ